MKKPPEGGVIKLRVRTLLMADPTTVNLFCIKEALQKYPEQSFAQKFGLCNR